MILDDFLSKVGTYDALLEEHKSKLVIEIIYD